MCQRGQSRRVVAPPLRSGRFRFQQSLRAPKFGAGEGNRTLVVSLEGFCSTIELHPLAAPAQMPTPPPSVKPGTRLTARKSLPYLAIRMTNLVAIAASSTAHLWWRPSTYAARWRD